MKKIIILICCIIQIIGCSTKLPTTTPDTPFDWPRYTDYRPAWSPDGLCILYHHSSSSDDSTKNGIYAIEPSGLNKRLFLEDISFERLWDKPDWSADGQWILLNELYSSQIYKIKYPSGDSLTQLTFKGRNFFPSWSPDGKRIAFSQSVHEPDTPESTGIWLMDELGTELKHLGLGYMPDWFPQGNFLAYSGPPGTTTAECQIWVADTAGQSQKQLTSLYLSNRYPNLSPDGIKIVFSSQAEEQGPRIWVLNTDGTNLVKLTETGGDHPAWSPDGTKIVYCNTVDGRLWIMNSDGSNKKQLTF